MEDKKIRKKISYAMVLGMLGCLCYGSGDYLMMYGNPHYNGTLFWLTDGVASISSWRNNLAMFLAFPGIFFYGIALLSLAKLIKEEKDRSKYQTLTIFGLTPWIALHLFYIMILYLYAWVNNNGYIDSAIPVCEALYNHLSWVIILSEVIMLPPFIFWFYLVIKNKTSFRKGCAFINPLVFYLILYLFSILLPDNAFRIGFRNALMSESMIICFALWLKELNK